MEDENLNNGLDNLLDYFKKLIEEHDLDSIQGINEEQKEQLKMFLEDFDELKDEVKIEIFKLDPQTKQLMASSLEQLMNYKGYTPLNTNPPTAPATPPVNKEKQLTDIPGTTENLEAQLNAIDDQLRKPDLSDDEINRLLDERSAIVAELGA